MIGKVRKLSLVGSLPPTSWDEEVLFTDGDMYFADVISGLDRAKNTIALESYIFEKGILADRLSLAIERAIKRGVQVQILVDGIGSPGFWRDYGGELCRQGADVKLYRAWPWEYHLGGWSGRLQSFFTRLAALNRGNHRKVCIVDNQVAWVGSMNVSDVHLREVHGANAWVDIGVRVRGTELKRLRRAFQSAFYRRVLQSPIQRRHNLLMLSGTFFLRRSARHFQVSRARRAQRHIWIQTPYFVPVRALYRTLLIRAREGLDIRIIVPANSDIPIARHLSYAFYWSLIEAGVRIFEYGPVFTHQKIAHFDDWTTIGSSNFNHRSFLHDLEVDVVLTRQENIHLLWDKFQREQQESGEITLESLRQLPLSRKILSWTLLIFRYWI